MSGKIAAPLPGLGGEFECRGVPGIGGNPFSDFRFEAGTSIRAVQLRHPPRSLRADAPRGNPIQLRDSRFHYLPVPRAP